MTRELYDHRGDIITVPANARTCFDTTGKWRTHRLFIGDSGHTHQALTHCGLRAGAIPGDETVDCPKCLDRGAAEKMEGRVEV